MQQLEKLQKPSQSDNKLNISEANMQLKQPFMFEEENWHEINWEAVKEILGDVLAEGVQENAKNTAKMTEVQQALLDAFHKLDANNDGKLSFQECKPLISVKMPETLLEKLFKQADASGDGYLQDMEFIAFVKMIGLK